jgi:hypothetical protein
MFSMHRWATAIAAGALILTVAGTASAATVYSNIPSTLPGNFPSWGFEAYQTSEFGGLVELASGSRTNPVVTVTMSSWGCQTGSWNGTCVTTPGTVFSLPITLNIYAVGALNSVGDLLASDTQTFKIPFRPSTDSANCAASGTLHTDASGNPSDGKQWFDGTYCDHGLAHNISWDLGGRSLTLPNKVIVAVMYNTSDEGYQPIGSGAFCHATGCGYDSLNVALVPNAPFVGTDPLPNDAYLSSISGGWYCDGGLGGLGLGIFRLDTGCDNWTGYRPAIQVDTYPLQTGPAGPAGADGATGPAGPAGTPGADGATGAAGAAGAAGATGATGPAGTAGATGATGPAGAASPAVKVQTPLQTKILKATISATKRTAAFWFSGSGGKGTLSYQCKLDNMKYSSCHSPYTYKNLKPGKHVIRVRAKDARGKVDQTPAIRRFKI